MTDFESPWTRRLRGNVARAGIAHIVVAWLFLQVADVVLPYVGVIDQPVRWALVVSVATFPVTLFIAWLADAGWRLLELLVIVIVAAAAGWWVTGNLPEGARERTNLVILPFEYGDDAAGEGISRALARSPSPMLPGVPFRWSNWRARQSPERARCWRHSRPRSRTNVQVAGTAA